MELDDFFVCSTGKMEQPASHVVHSCSGSFVGGFFVGILVIVLTLHLMFKYTRILDDLLAMAEKHRKPDGM